MIDDLLETVIRHRNEAQSLRRQGRKETDQEERKRLLNDAIDEFERAIRALKRGLRMVRRQQEESDSDRCRILEALSQTYGSLGGTWRDLPDFEQAYKQYDQGNEYEEERRQSCRAQDTYNMLQRLVVRLLANRMLIDDKKFNEDLEEVRDVIERQIRAGRDDSWALADLALVRILLKEDVEAVSEDLARRKADATFYESAYNAVSTLLKEGLGARDDFGSQLQAFKLLMKRKGGLA